MAGNPNVPNPSPQAGPSKAPSGAPKAKRVEIKTKTKIEQADFAAELDEQRQQMVDDMIEGMWEWKASVKRREAGINADRWDITSKEGLEEVLDNWKFLGIYQDTPFYQNIFSELTKCYNPAFLDQTNLSEEKKLIYMDPIANRDRLSQLNDPAFETAVEFFIHIQETLVLQDEYELKSEEEMQTKGDIDVLETAKDFVSSNVDAFMKSLKNGDYVTAGAYIGLLYLGYKAIDSLEGKTKDSLSKAVFWGGLAGCVYLFDKNTGHKIGKKLGIVDPLDEIANTPLAALFDVRSDDLDKLGPIDTDVYERLTFANLNSLYVDGYLNTNADKIQWIDPNRFHGFFDDKDFRFLTPANISKDADHLTVDEKEYKRVGHEIYKLVKAMEIVYNDRMKPHTGLSFRQALEDPVLKMGTVFDFMITLKSWTKRYEEETWLEWGQSEKTRERFAEVFEGKQLGFWIESAPNDQGDFLGKILDFPVVIRVTDRGYEVFSAYKYNLEGGNPHSAMAMSIIPFEGDAGRQVDKLRDGVITNVSDLIAMFKENSDGMVDFERDNNGNIKLDYDPSGFLRATYNVSGRGTYMNATSQSVDVLIKISDDGRSLDIERAAGEHDTLVHIEDVNDPNALFGSLVLAQMVEQTGVSGKTDFGPFKFLYAAGMLDFREHDPANSVFKVFIEGYSDKFVLVKFDGNDYSFVDPNVEQELLDDFTFRHALAESLKGSKRLEMIQKDFREILESADEDWLEHVFDKLVYSFDNWTLDGINLDLLTGSIKEDLFAGFFDAQITMILAQIENSMIEADSFSEVSDKITTIFAPSLNDLEYLNDQFRSLAARGEDVSEAEFDRMILQPLTSVGIVNGDYELWYRTFVNKTVVEYGDSNESVKLVSLYASYTAPLNDPDLINVDTTFALSKEDADDIDRYNAAMESLKAIPNPPDPVIFNEMQNAGTSISLTEVPRIRKLAEMEEKYRKYMLNASYANYVADSLLSLSPQQLEAASKTRSSALGITAYRDYHDSFERNEYVDSRPRMTMSSDCITFDKWLDLPINNPGTGADWQGNWPKEKIILPKESKPLVIKYKHEQEMLMLLLANGDKEKLGVSELEREFYKEMSKALSMLKQDYAEIYKVGKFAELGHEYDLPYSSKKAAVVPHPTVSNSQAARVPFYYDRDGKNRLKGEVINIEKDLKGISQYRTITRSDQERAIRSRIRQIIEHQILSEPGFSNYFNKPSVWDEVEDFFKKLWYTNMP